MKGWADYLERRQKPTEGKRIAVTGLILETPFVSVPNMLCALYPEKWLPYRYLSAFLRSTWDVRASAEIVRREMGNGSTVGQSGQSGITGQVGRFNKGLRVLLVSAAQDEVVPVGETAEVGAVLNGMVGGDRVRSIVVPGALHVECVSKPYGRGEVVAFLWSLGGGGK